MEDMPPGFRFYPTEEELVSFYLHNKLDTDRDDLNHVMNRVIPVVDIYDYNPWDLPQFSVYLCHNDPEQWFFFIPRQESEARGGRPKRLTTSGYWKATGSPAYVYSFNSRPIGVKRTMVFYNGRAPNGKKTDWKMNEYKAIQAQASSANATAPPTLRQEFSLCRIYKKSKCLRSFDRRPPPGILKIEEPIPRFHNNHVNQATQTRKSGNLSTMADAGGDDDEYMLWDVDGFWNPVD
ncbi:NAC domain containing protein 90 [Hibiscus trionum]|uniref:NAC domain containing protein 90 n=1 Tax=Hibiscus trionum TaxID=183268 RepID=A0A9W7JIE7_HIBTR|nr:NAC domain containing protein 90 [Hibiscus trionum]